MKTQGTMHPKGMDMCMEKSKNWIGRVEFSDRYGSYTTLASRDVQQLLNTEVVPHIHINSIAVLKSPGTSETALEMENYTYQSLRPARSNLADRRKRSNPGLRLDHLGSEGFPFTA
jgi:hypothetical protein